MVEPVVVWNNYTDAIFGYNSSTPVTVSIPDDLWDSWPDSVDFPGYKVWFFQLTYTAFDAGASLPTALVEVANLPDGPSFRFFAWLFPTTGGRAPRSTIGSGGNGLILSQSLAFRITSQGGDGQGYGWTGVTLLLVPPVSGSGGGGDGGPPPPPGLVPLPVVHAMAITTLAAFADPGGTSRRGRSFGAIV